MKNLLFLVIACLLLPLLGSCGSITVERQVFALCLGVDMTEDGQFLLTIQSPLGKPSTGVSDSGAGADGYDIISAQAEGLFPALHKMEAALPFPLNFSQLRTIIFSSDLMATYDLRPILMEIFHFPSTRATAAIVVSEGKAVDIIHAQRTSYGLRLSTYLDKLFKSLHSSGYMPNSTLASCIQSIGSGRFDPLLCLAAINPTLMEKHKGGGDASSSKKSGDGGDSGNSGDGGGSGSTSAFSNSSPVLTSKDVAGMLLKDGSNPVEYAGAAITANGFVTGYLTPREAVIYNHLATNAQRRCAIDGENLQLQLIIDGEDFETLYPEMKALMEKFQAMHADALGFGGEVAQCFLTNGEWNAYGFEERYPTADVYIGPGK